jgi:hypothetical protein
VLLLMAFHWPIEPKLAPDLVIAGMQARKDSVTAKLAPPRPSALAQLPPFAKKWCQPIFRITAVPLTGKLFGVTQQASSNRLPQQ